MGVSRVFLRLGREEGQSFEAGVVSGVENAPHADNGGVRTREVGEDDVTEEYLDER